MTRALLIVSFAVIYLATLGSVALGDVAIAAVVGVLVYLLSHTPAGGAATGLLQVVWLPRFLWGVAREILRGSAQMVLVVFGLRTWERQGVVEVPVGERSQLGVVVSSLVVGLSPGTILLDVDEQRRVMLFHVIDASDPEAVRRDVQRFYDKYQSRIFP